LPDAKNLYFVMGSEFVVMNTRTITNVLTALEKLTASQVLDTQRLTTAWDWE